MSPAKNYQRIEETKCMECGHPFDAIGNLGGAYREPQPGEPVACIRCGAVMTFEAGVIRGFTDEEMAALEADTEAMNDLARMIRNIRIMRAMEN